MSGSIRIIDMPDLGAPTDTSSVVGEKSGSGRFGIAALNTYLGGKFLPIVGGTLTGPLNIEGIPGNNQLYVGPWTETSSTGPYGSDVLVQRTWNISGGPQDVVSSIHVESVIEGAPAVFVWPISQWTRMRTSGVDGGLTPAGEPTGQHVGIASAMQRELGPSVAFMFGGQSIDSTGLVQPHTATIGMEMDIQANGPEDPSTGYYPGTGARSFLAFGPTAYPAPAWQPNHAYVLGNAIQPRTPNGYVYAVQVAGTSGATEPTWPTAAGVVGDGSVTWQYGTTHAMQVSRGISFGGSGIGAYPAQYGAGIFYDGSYFYDAMIDMCHGTLVDGGVKDAALRLGPNMPIDFSADGSDAGQNLRVLVYDGHFRYKVNGTYMFSISDTGGVSIGALETPGAQLNVQGTSDVGIDTAFGTFTTALRIADTQRISFTPSDTDWIHFATGRGITFSNQFAGDVASISSAGDISLKRGLGAFGVTAITTRPTVTGSKAGNAALGSLLTALASYGLVTDSSS